MTSQQPSSGTLLSKYADRLLDDGGNTSAAKSFAYRGQLDAEWELHSSAYRRLSRSAVTIGSTGVSNDQQITYNKNLISDFRNRRFDTVDGVTFTDLEVLCQLQHLGSATSLIDFSSNPLVALWFACETTNATNTPASAGVVFKVDTTYSHTTDPGRTVNNGHPPTFTATVTLLIPPHDLLAWEPPPISSARERVVAQHSILLLGKPLMASHPNDQRIEKILVPHADKQQLRDELATVGIKASTLFPDLHGFANTNAVTHPVQQLNTQSLLQQGLSVYHKGDAAEACDKLSLYILEQPNDWTARLVLSNVYVDLGEYEKSLEILNATATHINSLDVHEQHKLYANRANTKAAMGDHEGAISDYGRALQSGTWGLEDMLHCNRGNSYFALWKFQEALSDYETCSGSVTAAYNAGNSCIAQGLLGKAERKFTEAQNSPHVQQHALDNLRAVRSIIELVGKDRCDVEVRAASIPQAPPYPWIVIRSDLLIDSPQRFPIAGNTGNQGNIGWSSIGAAVSTGSKGFSGLEGMTVEVTNKA